jgi:hypothetical protein
MISEFARLEQIVREKIINLIFKRNIFLSDFTYLIIKFRIIRIFFSKNRRDNIKIYN